MFKKSVQKMIQKIHQKLSAHNTRLKFIVTFFICGIIFSVIGIPLSNTNDELYDFCAFSATICIGLWFVFLPLDYNKKNKIVNTLLKYTFGFFFTIVALHFWILIYYGARFSFITYCFLGILLIISIYFLTHIFINLFNYIQNQIIKKLFENFPAFKSSSSVSLIIQKITSLLVVITAFITAIINLIKLFS